MPEPFDTRLLDKDVAGEIQRLLERFPEIEPRRYMDGEYLVRQDEEDQDLYVVVRGAYTVEHPPILPTGLPVILASVMCDPEHPSIVGEMAYFGDYRRTASVRSSGSTYALCLKPPHIDGIIETCPQLTRILCQQFSRRLKEANDAIREFRSRFALVADRRMVAEGETLFAAGEFPEVIHQLLLGEVEIDRDGQKTIGENGTLFQGFLEPEAFLRRKPHAVTVVARTGCMVVTVAQEHRQTLIRCYPDLASRVMEG